MSTDPAAIAAAELAEMRARHLAQSRESQALLMDCMRNAAARANQPEPETPRRQPDPILEVTRLSRAVHQAMDFEARTIQGEPPRPRRPWRSSAPAETAARTPAPPPDRRRELVRAPLHQAIKAQKSPDQAQRLREIDDHLEALLAADPTAAIDPIDLLADICDHHAIHIDPKTLTDEILGIPPKTPPHHLNL